MESEGRGTEDSEDIVDGTCAGDNGGSKIQSAVVPQRGRARGGFRFDCRFQRNKHHEGWDNATSPRTCADLAINGSGGSNDDAPNIITPWNELTTYRQTGPAAVSIVGSKLPICHVPCGS